MLFVLKYLTSVQFVSHLISSSQRYLKKRKKDIKRKAVIAENYTSYLLDEVIDMTKTLTMLHCYSTRILCER